MSHHEPLTAKEKKKAQLKKNGLHQQLYGYVRMRRAEEKRVKDLEEARKPKKSEEKDSKIWSAKVATVRNRLTGQQRESKERWNRFAGTSDGGGRGL